MRNWKSNGFSNTAWLAVTIILAFGYNVLEWWWAPFAFGAAFIVSLSMMFEGRITEIREDIERLSDEVAELKSIATSAAHYAEQASNNTGKSIIPDEDYR